MDSENAFRIPSDLAGRLDLRPFPGKRTKDPEGILLACGIKVAPAVQAGEGRTAFHNSAPPNDDVLVLFEKRSNGVSLRFDENKGKKRRGVPEPQRDSSLSSSRAVRARPFVSFGRGRSQKPLGRLPEPSLIKPSR